MSSSLELLRHHRPTDAVAFGDAGTKTAADLLADAARVAETLPPASADSQVLLVFERDRYAMAVCLLASLERGHSVALPPTTRHDTILEIEQRPETVALLHDTDAGFATRADRAIDDAPAVAPLTAPITPHAGVIATVYTSGTTGPMTAWRKSSAELLGEAHWLGQAFGISPGDRVVGTVAPGHIYGLLFSVLMPLARGAAFSRETPHHAGALEHFVARFEPGVLVTVPVQLRAFASLAAGALAPVRRVFSSTGPLPRPVAKAFHARHGLCVSEILGSTETGGLASRERDGAEAPRWRPFDVVRVSVDDSGRLAVDSPFLHADLPRPFETADRVELAPDGSFTHLGRLDDVVKVGGRRVSLSALEDCLRQQTGVEEAAVLALPTQDVRGAQVVAAVAPASCAPSELRTALLERFEPSCLPRRLVAVDALPIGPEGKLQRASLLRLFGLRADGRPLNWELEWSETVEEVVDGNRRFACAVHVPEDYGWFEGHFEGYPVLAGAVQLKELVLPTVARALPEQGALAAMSRVKFTGRIMPGDDLVVRVWSGARRASVRFEIERGGAICSAGTLSFRGAAAAVGEDAPPGSAART